MGSPDDECTVVDSNVRIIGVDDLFVADASIILVSVRTNVSATRVAIDEHVADSLRKRKIPTADA